MQARELLLGDGNNDSDYVGIYGQGLSVEGIFDSVVVVVRVQDYYCEADSADVCCKLR